MRKYKLRKQLQELNQKLQKIEAKKYKIEQKIDDIESKLDPCIPKENVQCCELAEDPYEGLELEHYPYGYF